MSPSDASEVKGLLDSADEILGYYREATEAGDATWRAAELVRATLRTLRAQRLSGIDAHAMVLADDAALAVAPPEDRRAILRRRLAGAR